MAPQPNFPWNNLPLGVAYHFPEVVLLTFHSFHTLEGQKCWQGAGEWTSTMLMGMMLGRCWNNRGRGLRTSDKLPTNWNSLLPLYCCSKKIWTTTLVSTATCINIQQQTLQASMFIGILSDTIQVSSKKILQSPAGFFINLNFYQARWD